MTDCKIYYQWEKLNNFSIDEIKVFLLGASYLSMIGTAFISLLMICANPYDGWYGIGVHIGVSLFSLVAFMLANIAGALLGHIMAAVFVATLHALMLLALIHAGRNQLLDANVLNLQLDSTYHTYTLQPQLLFAQSATADIESVAMLFVGKGFPYLLYALSCILMYSYQKP